MTPPAYDAFEEFHASRDIQEMVPRNWLENLFPALKIRATADFNHFWFYSFLAFLAGKSASLAGLELHIHTSFLLLHFILFFMTVSLAYRYFKWRGVAIILAMAFISPMLWYFDKVHTEFFTFCLVLSAVILVCAEKYLPSALCLAVASTQNPSFALAALVPVFFRVVLERERLYTRFEVAVAVAAALVMSAHPVYYLARFGVVTPQLLAGGAALGRNLSSFFIWILDPDLGLLPNWPLGLLTLILVIGLMVLKRDHRPGKIDSPRWTVFFLLYLAINFYAHSSTTNLNSGATPGLARYALWYLPLTFPYLYEISTYVTARPRHLVPVGLVLLLLLGQSVIANDPRRPERYCWPSHLSYGIQSRISWAYNPPAEVFMERYSGFGESVHDRHISALVGPDCRKVLLLSGSEGRTAACPEKCRFDQVKLQALIGALNTQGPAGRYIRLSEDQARDLTADNQPGK
jgi:hypothetical protein